MITEKIKANNMIKHNLTLLDEVLQEFGLKPVLKNEIFYISPGFNEEFWLGIEIRKPESINIWFLIQDDIAIGLDRSSNLVFVEIEKLHDEKTKKLFEMILKSHVKIIYYGDEKLKEIYFFDNNHNILEKYSIATILLPMFLIKKLYKAEEKYFKPIIS